MLLKEYRKLRKLSVAEAAADIGGTIRALHMNESGETIPSPKRTKRILEWSGGLVTSNDHYEAYEAFHGKV